MLSSNVLFLGATGNVVYSTTPGYPGTLFPDPGDSDISHKPLTAQLLLLVAVLVGRPTCDFGIQVPGIRIPFVYPSTVWAELRALSLESHEVGDLRSSHLKQPTAPP
eukprot:3308762-Rhodomonas_salina.1